MFKSTIFLFIFGLAAVFAAPSSEHKSTNELTSSNKAKMLACIAELKFTEGDLDDVSSKEMLIPLNGNLACLVKCVGEKYGALNADGSLNLEGLTKQSGLEYADEVTPKLAEIAERCGKLTGSNPCETAAKISNCFIESGAIAINLSSEELKTTSV